VSIPPEWLQGKATYGGCSTALLLSSAKQALGAASPLVHILRSSQVAFLGATGSEVSLTSTVLRQGKSMSFVRSDLLTSEGVVATSATFAFGADRRSSFDATFEGGAPPELPPPEKSTPFFTPEFTPVFAQNFEARLARGGRPATGSKQREIWIWARHAGVNTGTGEVDGVDDDVALLALADMPPPAIVPAFEQPAPVSSVNWHCDFVDTSPRAWAGGWWLLHTAAEFARAGYSSQRMSVYGRGGALAASGRQLVAIYA
jgi:acyl-CoA thioesterase